MKSTEAAAKAITDWVKQTDKKASEHLLHTMDKLWAEYIRLPDYAKKAFLKRAKRIREDY